MTGTRQRRLGVLLGAAATALAGWWWIPGTALDHATFAAVIRGFANPPLLIAGKGHHNAPWTLQTLAAKNTADKSQAPLIVSLGDDPEGVFQSSPLSPIDLAVILSNFQRLGAKRAATAMVLAWDHPDPMGLAALDKTFERFESWVMAAPLSRGAVPEAMPAAFRNASLPLARVHGDTSALLMVNRIPLPGIILGGANTLAGFQVLEAEPPSRFAPLLARWEDRVVFAFPLLTVMQRLQLPLDGMEIRLGESLRLSSHGPIVPIDAFGRLAMPLAEVPPLAEIPAAALIDGDKHLFPTNVLPPVILRDDRSAAEPATQAFSRQLPALISALASNSGFTLVHPYPRLQPHAELLALALLALLLTALCHLPGYSRNIAFFTLAASCLILQCLAVGIASLWLPVLPAIAAIGWAWGLSHLIALTPAAPRHHPSGILPPPHLSDPLPPHLPPHAPPPTSPRLTPRPPEKQLEKPAAKESNTIPKPCGSGKKRHR